MTDDRWDDEAPILTHAPTPGLRPSTVVLDAISAVLDRAVEDIQPLYDVVDPDALDTLFAHRSVEELRFSYDDYRVHVAGDLTVRIYHR